MQRQNRSGLIITVLQLNLGFTVKKKKIIQLFTHWTTYSVTGHKQKPAHQYTNTEIHSFLYLLWAILTLQIFGQYILFVWIKAR